MSREYRSSESRKSKSKNYSRKKEPSPYVSKIVNPPSQHQRKQSLRHAVSHSDMDALEDYDEWDF